MLTESDVSGRRRPHRQARARARPVDGFFDDLAPGNFVVHRQHGVARYGGMVTRTMGGSTRDYLLLEYRAGDKLYLPTDQIDLLTPYAGGDTPTVSRLGGSEWQRARARARAAVHEVAEELVALYRRRLQVEGHAFGPDTPWQAELESSFPFVETVDQQRAIEEVKADMEQPRPMDRLVCGDVGFGKTEVAIRAAFKAVQDGYQVAVLVPTTLLATQHTQTFADRYAPFPVRVEMLSRFLTAAQTREVLAGLADGSVDVVIGTHRLLGNDVTFKKLGLLVVDEEQRFGVTHKEAIKAMTEAIDVLTLTANPIPRTLEMALTGIRDLSMVNTPPAARRPILTHVGEFDVAAASEAIRRELLREGQVFYVHNRVEDIDSVAQRVQDMAPEARIAIAHGQMDEGSLEKVVLDFWEGAYDVLVCTTIIESGIDMPMVNTLVVDRSDLLGLGQLHQLRGRVGRAGQRAYAYLFHPVDRVLSEQAYERLRTIGDHNELGSGFKIALRDLQIRGAGNLLGRDQSGHIAAIGYDLYVQLVSEAVAELKGEPPRQTVEISLDLPDDAHLPPSYVEAEDIRLEAYRRLSTVQSAAEVADVRAEWEDRFGPPPAPAAALLDVALLRTECIRLGITDVSVAVRGRGAASTGGTGAEALAKISPITLPASAEVRLTRLVPGATVQADLRRLLVPDGGALEGRAVRPAAGRSLGQVGSRRGSGRRREEVGRRREEPQSGIRKRCAAAPRGSREFAQPVASPAVKRLVPGTATVLVVLAAGLAVSACNVVPYAASANGTTISVNDLNGELHTLQSTAAGACLEEVQSPTATPPGEGAGGPGTYSMAYADGVLDNQLAGLLASQYASSKGITLSSSDLATAKTDLESTLDGAISTEVQQAGTSGTSSSCQLGSWRGDDRRPGVGRPALRCGE